MEKLATERLVLRLWHAEDFEPFAEFYADEAMARFVGGPCNREQAWRRMAAEIGHWALRGYGYWAVEERSREDLWVGSDCGSRRVGRSSSWATG